MPRLRTTLRKGFLEGPTIRPGTGWWAVPLYCAVVLWLHYVLVYALATGQMRARISTGWIEGRESTPILYWSYIGLFSAAVTFTDGLLIYRLLLKRRGQRAPESSSSFKTSNSSAHGKTPASIPRPMSVHCQHCAAIMITDHVKIGMTIPCPSCGLPTPLEYAMGTQIPPTGYSLTFANFMQLLHDASYRHRVGPIMEHWFESVIEKSPDKTVLRKKDGTALAVEDAHLAIQSDPKWQYELYQIAMDLWR